MAITLRAEGMVNKEETSKHREGMFQAKTQASLGWLSC